MLTLEELFTQERERVRTRREEILVQQTKLQDEIAQLDRDLEALDAYERIKYGRAPTKSRAPRGSSKRDELFNIVERHPEGVTRAELIEKIGVKGDKSGEQALSNALSALKKQGKVHLVDRKYRAMQG